MRKRITSRFGIFPIRKYERNSTMNQLITINYENETPTVSGRELHEALGVNTKYADWFPRMCEYGFAENKDYLLVSQICDTNNPKNPTTERNDHALTIPMAKELCMLQRSNKGKAFREYFIKCEEAWNSPEKIMERALQIARQRSIAAEQKIFALSTEKQQLQTQAEINKPKVTFADSVTASDNSILIRELAKYLKQNGIDTGEKRLYEWLRRNGYLIRGGSDYNLPTQKSMDLGLFEINRIVINTAKGTKNRATAKVTGKGQLYFLNKFLAEKDIEFQLMMS